MVVASKIRTYSYRPPAAGAAAVPGLNSVLRRMLSTDRAARYRDAGETLEDMELVSREPDADLCQALLEGRAVPALRALFLWHWAAKEGTRWKDTPENGRLYLAREVACNREAITWLVRERLEAGDSGSWDAMVLCTILLRSQVHPLEEAEAPEDYADVARFLEWGGERARGVAWSADKAAQCTAVMWRFIERHPPGESNA
jgi:hypothetical protein